MTQDHSFFVVGTKNDYYVKVYKHNGSQFNLVQTFTYVSDSEKLVSITEDHQYLTVSTDAFMYRYYYNETI